MTADATRAADTARSSRRTLLLLAVFSLGFLLVLGAVVAAKRRALRAALAATPIALRLEVAASGSATLVYTNVSAAPRSLALPLGARAGPEIDVVVEEGDAEPLPGPIQTGEGSAVLLQPGESFVQALPLGEYVRLRGRATVHVERARLREEEPRLRSNSATIVR